MRPKIEHLIDAVCEIECCTEIDSLFFPVSWCNYFMFYYMRFDVCQSYTCFQNIENISVPFIFFFFPIFSRAKIGHGYKNIDSRVSLWSKCFVYNRGVTNIERKVGRAYRFVIVYILEIFFIVFCKIDGVEWQIIELIECQINHVC